MNCERNRPRPLSHPRRLTPTISARWRLPLHFLTLLRGPTSAPMRRKKEKPRRHSSGILASRIIMSMISVRWSTLKVASLSTRTVAMVEKLTRRPVEWSSAEKRNELRRTQSPVSPLSISLRYKSALILASVRSLDPSLNPKCRECNSMDVDHVYRVTFRCSVCNSCKNTYPEKYSLLTKTECKEVCYPSYERIHETADIGYTMAGLFVDRSWVISINSTKLP